MDDLARRLREALASRADVRLAYLFGSRARGTQGVSSDVDVAVLVEPQALARGWPGVEVDLVDLLAGALRGRRVDVMLLNAATPVAAHEVVRDGILVVERDRRERIEFELDTQRRYLDTRPLRAIRDRAVSARHTARSGR